MINSYRIRKPNVEGMVRDTQEVLEQLLLPEIRCEYQIDEEIRILKEAIKAWKCQ